MPPVTIIIHTTLAVWAKFSFDFELVLAIWRLFSYSGILVPFCNKLKEADSFSRYDVHHKVEGRSM